MGITCGLEWLRDSLSVTTHHANIIPVFDVGEEDGVNDYVMQYTKGVGLDELLDQLREMRKEPETENRGER